MKKSDLLWFIYFISFLIILFSSPDPYMMVGLIIGVILGIDLEILDKWGD